MSAILRDPTSAPLSTTKHACSRPLASTVSAARARVALARAIDAGRRGGDLDLVTAAMRLWQRAVAVEVQRLALDPSARPLFYEREALLLSAELERLDTRVWADPASDPADSGETGDPAIS